MVWQQQGKQAFNEIHESVVERRSEIVV